MAEHFSDTETMAKILDAPSTIKAEEAMKEIKDFDENKWNEVGIGCFLSFVHLFLRVFEVVCVFALSVFSF